MILVDSNEKKWDHVKNWFEDHGVAYDKSHRLETGDFVKEGNNKITVDRKHGLEEVLSDLSPTDRNRFEAEMRRAQRGKVKLIFLVEGTKCTSPKDVAKLPKPSHYSAHTGKWLAEQMFRYHMMFNVEWEFCRSSATAKRICELLEVDYNV